MPATKINLLGLTKEDLIAYFAPLGERPFRAQQIIKWIHQLGVADFTAMSNLSLKIRHYLSEHAIIKTPQIVKHLISQDGTQKWLLRLEDKNLIETVFIPEKDRGTLCISTQAGCAMGCLFCATARLGLRRNLTSAEIIAQVWLAKQELLHQQAKTTKDRIITNVVIMGMGEPLLNFDNVIKAISLLRDDLAYGLSKYRITLSTVGLVPQIRALSKITDIALAISLHAPNDKLRNKLIPISKKYPLKDLINACQEFYTDARRRVTIEYIMINEINDTKEHAKELVKLLHNLRCKVNLIPCNTFKDSSFRPSTQERIDAFRNILLKADINTITRKTRGADIAAACGQLAAK